jgi:hypothetical protein
MLFRQSGQRNTLNGGPEYALKLSMGRNASQLLIARAEDAAWHKFAVYLENNFNAGRNNKTRDFSKIASGPLSIMAQYDSNVEAQSIQPILRMIHEAHREQLAKNRAQR